MKKYILLVFISLVVVTAFIAYRYYNYLFSENVSISSELSTIDIPEEMSLEALADSLHTKQFIKNHKSFIWVSEKMSYTKPRPGRYKLRDGMNNRELISLLRSGVQEPLVLTFNNVRTITDLCDIFGEKLEFSSESYCNFFTDSLILAELGFTKESILSLFIPNTYELYWNMSPSQLLERMKIEHDRFWNEDRTKGLEDIGLSQVEAYTLASIVQKETNLKSEKPIIAGVYLNRLKRGILLQADPTVVYAVGDFEIRRVLNRHLETDSPFNTYKYSGLPPGPICMPDISTIDAVINPQKHDYIYFCVKPGTGFEHSFARTLKEHNRNARAYREWLNSSRIYK